MSITLAFFWTAGRTAGTGVSGRYPEAVTQIEVRGLVPSYDLDWGWRMIEDVQPGSSGTSLGGTTGRRDIAGDWQGTFGERKLRLVVRVTASDEAAWRATLYSIDQTTQPIPIDAVVLEGRSFKFAVSAIRGSYEGIISPGGSSIAGTLIQGKSLPLELQRATTESAWLSTPSQTHFIEVEAGVKLEVVDWGGTGRPVVLFWRALAPMRMSTPGLRPD